MPNLKFLNLNNILLFSLTYFVFIKEVESVCVE